jgi:hypothetical protein
MQFEWAQLSIDELASQVPLNLIEAMFTETSSVGKHFEDRMSDWM